MIYEVKRRLRAAIKEAVSQMTEEERELLSKEIIERVEQLPQFQRASTIAAYSALPDEVCTLDLLHRRSNKRFLLPAIEAGVMVFREYMGQSDLYYGPFGIRQPLKGRIITPSEIDIMLVPGLAFDRQGNRLGRGKGFYDNYLSDPGATRIYKVGVCLPRQFIGDVPADVHDVPMDQIITAVSVTTE